MRPGVPIVAAAACAILAGCGEAPQPGEQPGTATGSPGTSVGPPAPTTTSDVLPESSTGVPAKPVGEEITVTGVVQPGVEPNCRVLATEDGDYLLLGSDPALQEGRRVVVTGTKKPETATTCMQGLPLEVKDVRPG